MSVYTTQIRWILEQAVIAKGKNPRLMTIEQIISNGRDAIFNFDWAYFPESANPGAKTAFEEKLLWHYFMDEIGQETVTLFRWALKDSLNLIMPYYNKLFESETLKFDKISNFDYQENFKAEQKDSEQNTENLSESTGRQTDASGEGESNYDSSNHSFDKHADTPQNVVDNIISHLTSADETDGTEGGSQSSKTSNNETVTGSRSHTIDYDHGFQRENSHDITKTGYSGINPNELLQSYRETILNIERDIIEDYEIKKCFMLVY